MRTRSSSNLVGESSPNPTTSNPKRRNCRRSKQPFILEEYPLDTMADQRSAASGNPLERRTQDVLTIIENKSKVRNSQNKSIVSQVKSSDVNSSSSSEIAKLTHAVNQQTSVVTTAMTTSLKQFQATPPPASVKAVEEICVTCGGDHPYYQCLTADGNTFLEFRDNIQGHVSAVAVNYNQGYNRENNFNQDTSYQAPIQQNQVVPLSELEKIKKMNEINIKAMKTQINNVKNELRNEMKTLIQASMSNQTNELKNMMASFFQMNTASTSGLGPLPNNTIANPKGELKAITTRSGLVLDGPSVPMPPPFINLEEDERAEETLTDPELVEYTIKVPPPLVQKAKPHSLRNYVKMLKALLSNKEKLLELANTPLNKNCSAVILKKLPEKLGDPGKFLISCGFSELKCKALADLGASINLMPLSVWKKLEYLLNYDPTKEMDSILKDSVDEDNLSDLNNDLVDTIPEMFTDKHTLDYLSPPLYDDVNDDLVEFESDNDDVYDDPFDSKEDQIKESKLLIDELDPPGSNDFPPSPECIFVHENLDEVTIRVTPVKNIKKISISNASLILEDFNPPLYELPSTKKFSGLKLYSRFHPKMRKKFQPRDSQF
uniref:Reverse transcriptase domain-containing protein n=1 Tax=Tanacetum cinerariifolium TaxID=118510 RepID=A0A6L2JMY3_TANCI|nr:reverse transcriptase domain-containing protein [Tanacetum cinerariifolium]